MQKNIDVEKLDVCKMRVLERIRAKIILGTIISRMEATDPKEGKHYDEVTIMEKYYCNL